MPLALGSDTNGSIRVPAALSGCFGLKPTFGRLSRHGAFPFVASLDHVGPFAATVHDFAPAYDPMQGPDPRDPACAGRAVAPVQGGLDDDAPLRVARIGGYFDGPLDADARAALERAAGLLAPRTGWRCPSPSAPAPANAPLRPRPADPRPPARGGADPGPVVSRRPTLSPLVRGRAEAALRAPRRPAHARRSVRRTRGRCRYRHDRGAEPPRPLSARPLRAAAHDRGPADRRGALLRRERSADGRATHGGGGPGGPRLAGRRRARKTSYAAPPDAKATHRA